MFVPLARPLRKRVAPSWRTGLTNGVVSQVPVEPSSLPDNRRTERLSCPADYGNRAFQNEPQTGSIRSPDLDALEITGTTG